MHPLVVAVVIAFVAIGALSGALNPQVIDYDFGFAQLQASKGTALLLGGALCRAGSGSARRRSWSSNRSSGNKA